MYQLYGIPNCDTVKKAKKYLDQNNISYEFINFKKTPPTKELILSCKSYLGELPINKRGTTYRKLKDQFESLSEDDQIHLMIEESSVIKRPILFNKKKVCSIGFSLEEYQSQVK